MDSLRKCVVMRNYAKATVSQIKCEFINIWDLFAKLMLEKLWCVIGSFYEKN